MTRGRWIALIVLVSVAATTGCTFRGPEGIRRELATESGVELKREFGITVGRTGMLLVKMFNNMAPEDEELPLKGIHKVQVGVYEVEGLRDGVDERQPLAPPRLTGWDNVVRVHEHDEDVFVLLRPKNDRIREMLVVVAESDEWVLVRVRGKLDRAIEQAMALAFDKADRPELYDPAVSDYRERSASPEAAEVSPGRTG